MHRLVCTFPVGTQQKQVFSLYGPCHSSLTVSCNIYSNFKIPSCCLNEVKEISLILNSSSFFNIDLVNRKLLETGVHVSQSVLH